MEINGVIDAFREALGLEICVKVFRANLRRETALAELDRKFTAHATPFCLRVKRTQDVRCQQCDLRDIPRQCTPKRGIWVSTCHAGATEIIVPVFHDGALALVLYLGQFRRPDGPAALPVLSTAEVAHRRRLAVALRAYFEQILRTPTFAGEEERGGRIAAFLTARLRERVTLGDLSRHLNLSVSRCGHVVREATGVPFAQLRDRLRLACAKDLLAATRHKTAFIAGECGFPAPQPFYRFFRKAAGMTPTEYRRRFRAEA